jgi:hypothetical protein
MVTSFPRVVEKRRQAVAQNRERVVPRAKRGSPVVGERVRALRRAREIGLPLRDDQALLLERTQCAIHVSDIDALLPEQLGQSLEQLVTVRRALREKAEDSGLAESLDPRADSPAAVR